MDTWILDKVMWRRLVVWTDRHARGLLLVEVGSVDGAYGR
jgi:hypothetical protein